MIRLSTILTLAMGAVHLPALAQCPGFGDCCTEHAGPGCDDTACCLEVCFADPYCCDIVWDGLCAGVAGDTCAVCGAGCPGTGDCCAANGTPGCSVTVCCALVCAGDPYCCDTLWDETCALQAAGACATCQASPCPGAGDCCQPHGTPGCDQELCCLAVCAADDFCCDEFWDALCASRAGDLCAFCVPTPTGDIDGDGAVGVVDLLALLSQWGPCADCGHCPGDFDGSCDVGVLDLLTLLSNVDWSRRE